MKHVLLSLVILILLTTNSRAAQSIITEVEGSSCAGDDKSRKQTELVAVQDAKRKGGEYALTYITSETKVNDSVLEKDLISAYSKAQVKVLQELQKAWYKEESLGDCFRVKLKVEVIPDEHALSALDKKQKDTLESDPMAPLTVKIWTDRMEYREGEKMKVYLKGNKPFFGRVVYKDAGGNLVQLLPNPQRKSNYFHGGTLYELPSGDDLFVMEVTSPFGIENLTLYASTAEQGNVEVKANGSGAVYEVTDKPADIPINTRGIKLSAKSAAKEGSPSAAEFSEAAVAITTQK